MKRILPSRPWWAILLLLALAAAPGCQSVSNWFFGEKEPPRFLHVHTFTWEPTDENRLTYVEYAGRVMYLDPEPVLSSATIVKVEPVDTKDGKGLKVQLSEHGRNRWLQATAQHRNKQFVIMLDNDYRGSYQVTVADESGVVVLPGSFTPKEADGIVAKVKENFKR